MPVLGHRLRAAFRLLALVAAVAGAQVWAAEGEPIHFSAKKQLWDRRANQVDLIGAASVSQPGETLSADEIHLDLAARLIDAKGNCVYTTSDSVIYGEEMHFNMETRTGSIVGGRIVTNSFTLSGERINKLGMGRFQTHWGEYSTCRDCPKAWTLQAEDVDMQFEGYAQLSNVITRVKDAPALWFPYLIIPMKTKRQSGLLAPSFSASGQNGVTFVQPFFWAISRSLDMTIAGGVYANRGERLTWEGRYSLGPNSWGRANFFYLRDNTFRYPSPDDSQVAASRLALFMEQRQQLPFGIDQKLKLTEVSDNLYPFTVGDVQGGNDATIQSQLSLAYSVPGVSANVSAHRIRNLLNTSTSPTAQRLEFDPRTVQVLPRAELSLNDHFVPGLPVAYGLSLGLSNFTRGTTPFDPDPGIANLAAVKGTEPVIGPIRQAMRASATPVLYTTLRPFDRFNVVPSLQYRWFFYSFPAFQASTLNRGYLHFQTDFSTQLERFWEFPGDPDVPVAKHLIRPILNYSNIPFKNESDPNHPFLNQVNAGAGYNFDNYDIVPIDSTPNNINYFIPQGNSLTYGLTSQWIRKRPGKGAEPASYSTASEVSVGQAVDFRNSERPFTRLFSSANLNFDRYALAATYYYYPYLAAPRNYLSTSMTMTFEKGVHQRILRYDRSVTLAYTYNQLACTDLVNNPACGTQYISLGTNFSINDYILPSFSVGYNFITSKTVSSSLGVQFQSPSQCYKLDTGLTFSTGAGGIIGLNFAFNLTFNFTGSGFGGVSELASSVVNR